MPKVRSPIYKRLVEKLSVHPSGCWIWTGWKDRDGYGRMGIIVEREAGKRWYNEVVSRIVFQLFNGPLPKGMCALHHCDNPTCMRPSHLFRGTNTDNMRDKTRKGRNNPPVGERSGSAKLTNQKIKEIRTRHAAGGITQRALAKEYGVGFKAISKIILRQRWGHV